MSNTYLAKTLMAFAKGIIRLSLIRMTKEAQTSYNQNVKRL